jgi:hypothetical protein
MMLAVQIGVICARDMCRAWLTGPRLCGAAVTLLPCAAKLSEAARASAPGRTVRTYAGRLALFRLAY